MNKQGITLNTKNGGKIKLSRKGLPWASSSLVVAGQAESKRMMERRRRNGEERVWFEKFPTQGKIRTL